MSIEIRAHLFQVISSRGWWSICYMLKYIRTACNVQTFRLQFSTELHCYETFCLVLRTPFSGCTIDELLFARLK